MTSEPLIDEFGRPEGGRITTEPRDGRGIAWAAASGRPDRARDRRRVGAMDLGDLRAPAGGVLVVPMGREEFEALPPIPGAEWWDGACVVSGTTGRHARAIMSLGAMLLAAVGGGTLDVLSGAGWRLPDAEFAPDVSVVPHLGPDEADSLLTSAPLLLVEVLSRSTRHIDLGRKLELYAAGGAQWYWVVDLHRDELIVYENQGGCFAEVQRFASGATIGPLAIDVVVHDL